jgi:hypothetical protein
VGQHVADDANSIGLDVAAHHRYAVTKGFG